MLPPCAGRVCGRRSVRRTAVRGAAASAHAAWRDAASPICGGGFCHGHCPAGGPSDGCLTDAFSPAQIVYKRSSLCSAMPIAHENLASRHIAHEIWLCRQLQPESGVQRQRHCSSGQPVLLSIMLRCCSRVQMRMQPQQQHWLSTEQLLAQFRHQHSSNPQQLQSQMLQLCPLVARRKLQQSGSPATMVV